MAWVVCFGRCRPALRVLSFPPQAREGSDSGSIRHAASVTVLMPLPQAWCLDPILLSKTQAWAASSSGCFPTRGGDGYVRYSPGREGEGPQIRWAKIKSIDRAIEKAVRVYYQVHRAPASPPRLVWGVPSVRGADGRLCGH